MLNNRTTTKSIETKTGRVIAPSTRISVLPWPEDEWRMAVVLDEEAEIVKLSERDLRARTAPAF